jgi:acetyl-CoA acetyltransferase
MSNSEALVFDAIRTPRGRGKVNGSLHTVKPVDLAALQKLLALPPRRTGGSS